MCSTVVGSVLFFLAIFASMSAGSALLIVKFVPHSSRVASRMLTQPTLTVAGMMFAILLGFFTAQAMRDFATSSNNVIAEASALGDVFRNARGLSEVDRNRIRKLCRKYADLVIGEEWPLMAKGQYSDKAQSAMNELWEAALSITPSNQREQVIDSTLMRAMNEFGAYRRLRIATNVATLEPHMWAIIAFGAASLVSLTFLFGPDSKRFHVGILCCLVIPLTLNMLLLAEYSHPFTGLIILRPAPFENLRDSILIQDDEAPRFLTEQKTSP